MESFILIISSAMASTGFWSYMSIFSKKKNIRDQLLLGMASQQIINTGDIYIERGYITTDEYKNFSDYLYKPYLEMGGNGLGQKIFEEIKKLPIKDK